MHFPLTELFTAESSSKEHSLRRGPLGWDEEDVFF